MNGGITGQHQERDDGLHIFVIIILIILALALFLVAPILLSKKNKYLTLIFTYVFCIVTLFMIPGFVSKLGSMANALVPSYVISIPLNLFVAIWLAVIGEKRIKYNSLVYILFYPPVLSFLFLYFL